MMEDIIEEGQDGVTVAAVVRDAVGVLRQVAEMAKELMVSDGRQAAKDAGAGGGSSCS